VRDLEKYADPPRLVRHLVWCVSTRDAERGARIPAIDHAASQQEALLSLKAYAQMQLKRGVNQVNQTLIGVEFGTVNGHTGWFAVWS
jgi:hypothetical protein